jgi:hypothetical protein
MPQVAFHTVLTPGDTIYRGVNAKNTQNMHFLCRQAFGKMITMKAIAENNT